MELIVVSGAGGLLINFNVEHLKNGIKRVINSHHKFY